MTRRPNRVVRSFLEFIAENHRMFGWLKKKPSPHKVMPTVSFDSRRVDAEVLKNLEVDIRMLPDIPADDFHAIYDAATISLSRGRDLSVLSVALQAIDGMTKKRAGEIALLLNNRATARMDTRRRLGLGITHAIWRHSGVPCGGTRLDAAHKRLDGKRYSIEKGAAIGQRRTWPGVDEGCKCISAPIIEGFDS